MPQASPDNLAPSWRAQSDALPSSAHVTVRARVLGDDGRWSLTVELAGGRRLPGVRVLTPREGARSGTRPPVPDVGAQGLVLFPESAVNGDEAYWLGFADLDRAGLHVENPDDEVALHRSGYGRAVQADGGVTERQSNGDTSYQGPGTAPYAFRVRDGRGVVRDAPVFRRAMNRVWDWALTRLVSLRVGGDMAAYVDAVRRRVGVAVGDDEITLEDGRARVRAEVLEVGTDPGLTSPVALWAVVFTNERNAVAQTARLQAKVKDLTGKYNGLRDEVAELKSAFGSHTHGGVTSGLSSTLAPVTVLAKVSESAVALADDQRGPVVDGVKTVDLLDGASRSLKAL